MNNSKGTLFPKRYNMTPGVDVQVTPVRVEGTTSVVELYVVSPMRVRTLAHS